MKVVVELEVDNPHDINKEEIEQDLRKAENNIGWNYDYKIVSVEVIYARAT